MKAPRHSFPRWIAALTLLALSVTGTACIGGSEAQSDQVLQIARIPDQDIAKLESRFNGVAEYLTRETGIRTRYVPAVDYAAVVTGFKNGDLQLAWFGGLTGVQARLVTLGAQAIAQRPEDERFKSVFITQKGSGIRSLADLKGKTFTFGSEISTSGHLMPRYYLQQAGLTPETDFAAVNYSGSHDTTWKLIEAGSFQAGAMNWLTWESRVKEGVIDLSKVEVFYTTPEYYDYHWLIRGDVDAKFGTGAADKVRHALLGLNAADGEEEKRVIAPFDTTRFISTRNESYKAIEDVARGLKIVE